MSKIKNALIVEHEGLLVDVLKNAFTCLNNKENSFRLKITDSCKNALNIITTSKSIDLALININTPPSEDEKFLFIEDVCLKLRYTFPKIKIIIFSTHKNNAYLHSLFKTINPECLLIKSDINFDELLNAIESVTTESLYYSKSVLHYMRRRIANNITIDNIDKTILHYLSIGIKMKDLPKYVSLSKSTIEIRKRRLKEIFGVENKGDYYLLQSAEEKGFV